MNIGFTTTNGYGPRVNIKNKSLLHGVGTLLLDTGADINIIRKEALSPTAKIKTSKKVEITGVGPGKINTLGTTTIKVFGQKLTFHVLPAESRFTEDGLLGNTFFVKHKARMFYDLKKMEIGGKSVSFDYDENNEPNITKPEEDSSMYSSSDNESDSSDEESNEPKVCYRVFRIKKSRGIPSRIKYSIPPRMKVPIEIPVTETSPSGEAYLPLVKTSPGVFIGNAAVINKNKTCFAFAINTTEEDAIIDIPAQELQRFDLEDSDDFFESEPEGSPPSSMEERVEIIYNSLKRSYHDAESLSQLKRVVGKFSTLFMLPGDTPPKTTYVEHSIPTTDEKPVYIKQYRYPPALQKEVKEQMEDLLMKGIITRSSSAWNSPLWIVPKRPGPDGKVAHRIVVDYRKLNEKTIPDAYPLPNIQEILETIGNPLYFSVFDLVSGFHQVGVNPTDQEKTAFSTPYGHFHFLCMPFGLRNAPPTFQRLMDTVMSGLQGTELFVYLDDIIVFSDTLEAHEQKINEVFTRLFNAGLKLKLEKCEYLTQEVRYLGHHISKYGIKPDPEKIRAVKDFPVPKSVTQVRSFLGLANYYRRFIKSFADIANPMNKLLKKGTNFYWDEEQQKSFEALKDSLCTAPVLVCADLNEPFILTTDASEVGIGAVLSQGLLGEDRPVAYMSKSLNNHQKNYSATERECLAVIMAVMHFRHYLWGRKFLIIGDHEPLTYIESIKDPMSRLNRWRARLRGYIYDFKYKPGRLNTNADSLSRNPCDIPEAKSKGNQTAQILPLSAPKQTKTSLARQRKSKSKSDGDSTDSKEAIIIVKRGRKKGSKNAPPTPPLNMSAGQGDLDASTIGKRLQLRRRTEKKVKFSDQLNVANDDNTDESLDSELLQETPDGQSSDSAPPVALKDRSFLPNLVREQGDPTSPDTDTDSLSEANLEVDSEYAAAEKRHRTKVTEPRFVKNTAPVEMSKSKYNDDSPSTTSDEEEIETLDASSTREPLSVQQELDATNFDSTEAKEFVNGIKENTMLWDSYMGENHPGSYFIPLNYESRNKAFTYSCPDVLEHELGGYRESVQEDRLNQTLPSTFGATKYSESDDSSDGHESEPNVQTPPVKASAKSTPKPNLRSTIKWPRFSSIVPVQDNNISEQGIAEKPATAALPNPTSPEPIPDSQNQPTEQTLPLNQPRPIVTRILPKQIPSIIQPGLNHTPPDQALVIPSRDCLTYKKDNIIHFSTQTLEFDSPNAKQMLESGIVNKEDLSQIEPALGKILTLDKRGRYVFVVLISKDTQTPINPAILEESFKTLANILTEKGIKSIRIARKGEIIESLPKGALLDSINTHLRKLPITITICTGVCITPTPEERPAILKECHDSLFGGHRGVEKTYRRIRERYTWPGLRKEVHEYINKCRVCQEFKLIGNKVKEPMVITDTPSEPFYKVSIDTVGPLYRTVTDYKHILTMQCLFTKYCIAVPVKDIKAKTIAVELARHLIPVHGVPRIILSDRGKSFRNNLLRHLAEIFGFKMITTTAYRPQSNGSLERTHAPHKAYLRTMCGDKQDWDQLLPFAIMNYNSSPNESTGFTPCELLMGRNLRMPSLHPDELGPETFTGYARELSSRLVELRELAHNNLIKSKYKSKLQYDKKANPQNLEVGMKVYLKKMARKNKMDKFYNGVFTILEITEKNNLLIEATNGKTWLVHKDRVKRCYE